MRPAGPAFKRRRDGRWVARYYDGAGKRREIVRDTARAAEAARADVLAGYTTDQTLETFLRWWVHVHLAERVAEGSMARRTFDGYEANVRLHIVPHIGDLTLRTLTPQHVEDLLSALRKQGKHQRTRQYVHTTLRAALKVAVRNGLVVKNAAQVVHAPRVSKRPVRALSEQDARRFLVACTSDRDGPLWATMLTLGLRIGEAFALSWDDVDLDEGWLWPRMTVNRVRGGHEFKRTKGWEHDQDPAPIAIPEGTVAFLGSQRDLVTLWQIDAADAWHNPDGRQLVFPGRTGGVQSKSMAAKRLAALCERAGLPKLTPHMLRHQFASLHLARGATLLEVQHLLRHKSGQQTSDTYSHLLPGDRRAAERMGDLFG